MTLQLALSLLLSATFAGWIPTFKLIRYLQARKQKQQQPGAQSTMYYAQIGNKVYIAPLPGKAYEVGSPKYHAQVVSMIRTLNEQLAKRGKRISEKTAMEIAGQTAGKVAQSGIIGENHASQIHRK